MKSFGKFFTLPLLIALFPLASANAQSPERVTFATRNIYLGADVGVAMKKLPNFPSAAQFMWDQVKSSNFSERAPLLARELIATGASVIGIQEATTWRCRAGFLSKEIVVYDFLEELLAALAAQGAQYSLATFENRRAINPGFEISPIPHLTLVRDEELFPELFGKERVACGFTISDALLVREEVRVLDVGNSEYSAEYSIIPTLMTIYRGYTWADLRIGASSFRAVTTHLESLWDSNVIPNAAIQADQIISDLAMAKMPVVVMGDFNSDPRDPRRSDAPNINPGQQPSASQQCREQVAKPTVKTAIDTCSAYWKFIRAGFTEISPDAQDPKYFSWGADALLAGGASDRLQPSLDMGGNGIFTDRLDYIFIKNGQSAVNGAIFGNQWPEGLATWRCNGSEQAAITEKSAQALGKKLPNEGRCLPSDHAGVAGAADLPLSDLRDPRLPERNRSPLTFWRVTGGALALAFCGALLWLIRRQSARRRVGGG